MKTIHTTQITQAVRELCIEANHFLTPDMDAALKQAAVSEKSPLGKQILNQLQDNLQIAGEDQIPICQDTGMAVIFMEIGQDVHFEGGLLEDAVNEGVRQGYTDGFLRKSVVKDPLLRENTKDNTPAVIHYELTLGDQVTITVAPKGFGSENMSRHLYAQTCRRHRGRQKCDSHRCKRCRSQRLPAYGRRRRHRRNF